MQPQSGEATGRVRDAGGSLSNYGPPPPPRSAYPSPEDGGFEGTYHAGTDYGPPGPGYDQAAGVDDDAGRSGTQTRADGLVLPVAATVVLASVLVLGLVYRPLQATVIAGLAVLGAGVLAISRPGPVGRFAVVGAAGPVAVLIFYWASALVNAGLG